MYIQSFGLGNRTKLKQSNKQTNSNLFKQRSLCLLLKDIPTYDLENVLENVLFQYIQTNIQSKSIKSSLETFISLIEKRGLEKHSIKGVTL